MSDQDENEPNERTVIVTAKVDPEAKNSGDFEPYLIQLSGKETGHQVNLSNRNVRIGRDPSCEVHVEDPHVSRQHAMVEWVDGKPTLKDLGSTNGVAVNDQKVKEQVLKDGDRILVGTRLYFKFCYQDAHEQNYQQTLYNAANIDSLTGLYSRKFFQDIMTKEFSFSRRGNSPLSLLMVDIDHFKRINDNHGHQAGDEVLRRVGAVFKTSLRMENIAARYGGEEFAIILRNVNSELATQIGERLRKSIECEKIEYADKHIPVTISVGIATLDDDNFQTVDDLIRAADENLYEAKEKGRNCIVFRKVA